MLLMWTSTLDFNNISNNSNSNNISPNGALSEHVNVFFLTCFSVTLVKENFSLLLKVSFYSFHIWMIWNFTKTSSRVTVVPRKYFASFFKSNSAVIFIKPEFFKFACYFSSLMRQPYSSSKSLLEFKALLLKVFYFVTIKY